MTASHRARRGGLTAAECLLEALGFVGFLAMIGGLMFAGLVL